MDDNKPDDLKHRIEGAGVDNHGQEDKTKILPLYASPLYKVLAIWGLIVGINGLFFLTLVIILLLPHGRLFNLQMLAEFGLLFLAMLLIFSFSLRWLLRYGKYIKLSEQPWWKKGIMAKQTKETPPTPKPS